MRAGRIDLVAAVAFVVVVGVAACGGGGDGDSGQAAGTPGTTSADAPVTGSFVGAVEGSDAYLAVVAGAHAVVGFATDGTSVAEPFGGGRDGDQVDLESRDGDQLSVEVTGDAVTGTVEIDGEAHDVALEPAEGGAGLYRSAGAVGESPVWAGWVVLNDGSQLGAGNTASGIVEPPPVDTDTATITSGDVTADVAKVEPDDSAADVEGPGDEAGGVFEGGSGFAGGFPQFGGFTQFGGFGGGFGGGGSVPGGFGGFGFGTRMGD